MVRSERGKEAGRERRERKGRERREGKGRERREGKGREGVKREEGEGVKRGEGEGVKRGEGEGGRERASTCAGRERVGEIRWEREEGRGSGREGRSGSFIRVTHPSLSSESSSESLIRVRASGS